MRHGGTTHAPTRALTSRMQAAKLCPSDPLVANELGVLAYRNRQYEAAAAWLRRALALVPGERPTPGTHPNMLPRLLCCAPTQSPSSLRQCCQHLPPCAATACPVTHSSP
jgi:Tfp pilus assembly protein PilF